ncbi:LysR family transcriptional regulator [Paraburkholderia tropica]|uniref:LysR family transcriptional regulator n=2 Tax=Burkholderiales TaxID=80840 RepID=A0A1A5XHX3_9BURK|nr:MULTISPECIES: LysR family transcriptional regulator [Paraburkholderia]MBB2980178.1 DNA-binding transcriptional LysR family regulator [Paraburkholderia tropica]MBB3001271.1 DNA-binding transcriptional LysR family regulator [Paraburkholderia tropica]MBB6320903.1 DNA-binding transcriptional LysR family regulator [Paraburkholderia tropica]MDE1140653.1 LysR family transcriptional regulator [Paraburkholderia tropica]OBR52765.1 transcriptional regulator [Paraburkholderia tropica]
MPADIRTIDLNLLRALDALLDERNVTRAARRLALTQPAVSGMLVRLREAFDDPLFIRTQRGIAPTLRALELVAPLKQILGEVETLLTPQAFDPASADFTLTLAATDYALQAVVAPYLAVLRREAPGIRVAVVPVQDPSLHAQLARGDVDVALVTPESTPADLHARRLFDERYVCVMRADHPDAARGRITLARFCALDHALVSYTGGSFHGVTDEALAQHGRARRVALSVTSFLVLPEILRASDLIAVVPQRLAQRAEGLAVLPAPLEIPGFTKTAAWHERTHRDPARRWARALLFETCESLRATAAA